jgi:hypothetical protein
MLMIVGYAFRLMGASKRWVRGWWKGMGDGKDVELSLQSMCR